MNLFDIKIYIIDVKVNGLKINFSTTSATSSVFALLHCDVDCFDCHRRKPQLMYISNLVS